MSRALSYRSGRSHYYDLDSRKPWPGRYMVRAVRIDPVPVVCDLCHVDVKDWMIYEWARRCVLNVVDLAPVRVRDSLRSALGSAGRVDELRPLLNWRAPAGSTGRYASMALGAWVSAIRWRGCDQGLRNCHEAADDAWRASRQSKEDAGIAAVDPGFGLRNAELGYQRDQLHQIIWTAHGETLTTRERIELARDLRYYGADLEAAAVLPQELREGER